MWTNYQFLGENQTIEMSTNRGIYRYQKKMSSRPPMAAS